MSNDNLTIGIDIGSVSINTIVCNNAGTVVEEMPYKRHFGRTLELCAKILDELEKKYDRAIARVVFTGTHGEAIAKEVGTYFEIETTAQTKGLFRLMPTAKSVISIGGHDSALLLLSTTSNSFVLEDFKLNEACAAGTGSFIDQQAERMFADTEEFHKIVDPQQRIEAILQHFVEVGILSDNPANVACRCTVFTKSDMIHLQNKGIASKHIIAGLHEGVAKNFKSTLITNRILPHPVAFIGGYASNKMAKKSFEKILNQEVEIPPVHTSVGAYGAALNAIDNNQGRAVQSQEIKNLGNSESFAATTTPPLCLNLSTFSECGEAQGLPAGSEEVPVFIGFDIGSTTTKMVVISPSSEILYKRYIPTEGQPVVAIRKCMRHLMETLDYKRLTIKAVGTTGSGREVANLFMGADDVVNEVTAHARGTTHFNPKVDTIFELGGQDAKYTALSNGFVVDFRMNKVCAAGTGSFLEETANKLGINIAREYEDLAIDAKTPYRLTERCTVYMESDLMSFLQTGAKKEDLLAGLSQAVVHNYLNRVVQDGKIGNVISFQGGPSLNKSVVAAFEAIVGKPIVTLPHREVMGAIGAALHARDELEEKGAAPSKFRGWDAVDASFSHQEEVCRHNPKCHNLCKLQNYTIGNEKAVYGGECGMFESRGQSQKRAPDFAKIRQQLFFRAIEGKYRTLSRNDAGIVEGKRPTLGIPQCLTFFQLGIFWIDLMTDLGFDIVISQETDNTIVDIGIEAMTCEACFPVKISHGHAGFLKDKVDFLFLPMMIEMEAAPNKKGYYCPYVEANTYMLQAALNLNRKKVFMPAIYLKEGPKALKKAFKEEFSRLGIRFNETIFDSSHQKAHAAKVAFERELKRVGKAVLDKLDKRRAIIVAGRPYSAYDSRTNLNLFNTFSRLGIIAIPQEFLSLEELSIEPEYTNMYWGFGEKILKTAKFINNDSRLFGLYLTSFSCGPDSFILHFFNHEMNRTGRPYLELELDEHSAGAGVETRLLAFIDVIKNQQKVNTLSSKVNIIPKKSSTPLSQRTLYVPKMAEGSTCLAAAFKGVGCNAEVMPTYTKEGLEFGKSHNSGKECFPCTVTTGDMFHLIDNLKGKNQDIQNSIAFFMPETEGPCRFGQYNKLHRILLDSYGLDSIPIISPSSEDSYKCDGLFSDEQAKAFRKLAWQAIVYADLIEKAVWRIRPYEREKGLANEIFHQAMKDGVEAISRGGGLKLLKAAKRAGENFGRIPRGNNPKPLVGIVGEIYLRTHRESNQDLVRTLEGMGCETFTSSISEWIEYTTHTGYSDSLDKIRKSPTMENYLSTFDFWATAKYQRLVTKMFSWHFRDFLNQRRDHDTGYLLKLVENIFSNHINGEAILSIAGALAFQKDGFNGVVNSMPFTCMPSTIASSILKVHTRNKIPFIDMVYDGTILPNRNTNLATFVFQAKQHKERKSNFDCS